MKFYKYMTLALAAVVTLASCQKEEGDGLSDQNKGKAKPEAAVSVVSAVDDTLTFSVTATGTEVSQFGWVVFEGTDNEAPAPLDIVIDEVSGSYASGVFDAADGMTGTASIEVEPYGEYQIFAVAITKTGLLGKVVSINATIGDTTPPVFGDFATQVQGKQLMFGLQFDEPVELTGEGEFRCFRFAINDTPLEDGSIAPHANKKGYAVPQENIMVQGNTVIIVAPEECYNAGAYVCLTFSEGVVKNAAGIANDEGYDYYYFDADGFDTETIGDGFATEDIELSLGKYVRGNRMAGINPSFQPFPADTVIYFPNEAAPSYDYLQVMIGTEKYYDIYEDEAKVVFQYTTQNRVVTYQTDPDNSMYDLSTSGVCYMTASLKEEPAFGTSISVFVPAGVIEDIWGNVNVAFEADDAFFYSYGYDMDDICGTYDMEYVSYNPSTHMAECSFVIAPFEDEEYPEYNVQIFGNVFGFDNTEYPIIGAFDGDGGTLVIPTYQSLALEDFGEYVPAYSGYNVFWSLMTYTDYYYYKNTYDDSYVQTPIVFTMPESGVLVCQNEDGLAIVGDIFAPDFSGWLGISSFDYPEVVSVNKVSDEIELPVKVSVSSAKYGKDFFKQIKSMAKNNGVAFPGASKNSNPVK